MKRLALLLRDLRDVPITRTEAYRLLWEKYGAARVDECLEQIDATEKDAVHGNH